MKRWSAFKKFASFLIAMGLITAASIFVGSQFRLANIQHDALVKQEVVLDTQEQVQLEDVLSQSYRYLDRGRQSYVFISQDEKYVIKFFDLGRYKQEVLTFIDSVKRQYTPFELKNWINLNRMKRKMNRLFSGYKLAYECDRDYACIIYQQLYPNPLLNQSMDVYDRFGFKHHIDLSQVPFVVQSTAIPTRIMISGLLEKGNVLDAKMRLRQLLDMYVVEYDRGIYDRDHNFMYNTGFVNGKPMRLDVGRLKSDEQYKERCIALQDLKKIAIDRTEGWLHRHFPQYRDEIMADMQLKLESLKAL